MMLSGQQKSRTKREIPIRGKGDEEPEWMKKEVERERDIMYDELQSFDERLRKRRDY
jgi:hypothetical protein